MKKEYLMILVVAAVVVAVILLYRNKTVQKLLMRVRCQFHAFLPVSYEYYMKRLEKIRTEALELPPSIKNYHKFFFKSDCNKFKAQMKNDQNSFDVFNFNVLDATIDTKTLQAKAELREMYDKRFDEMNKLNIAVSSSIIEQKGVIGRLERQLQKEKDILAAYEDPTPLKKPVSSFFKKLFSPKKKKKPLSPED